MPSHRPAVLHAALVLALATSSVPFARAIGAAAAAAPTPATPARIGSAGTVLSPFAGEFKRLQRQALLEGAQRRIARARVFAQLRRNHPELAKVRLRARLPKDWSEAGGPQGVGANRSPILRAPASTRAKAALGPNVIVNDRSEDGGRTNVGQAEQMVGVYGPNVLIAFNDGLGFELGSGVSSTQGYSYSTDGGQTYTDGGVPPLLSGWEWTSDPVVTVDPKTGEFWYCALVDIPNNNQNGVGVVKATFGGTPTTIQWGTPTLAWVFPNSSIADKPWMVVDSLSGRLYLSYTVFSGSGSSATDNIYFQRSAPGGTSWEAPQTISQASEAGAVQGSRPAVGPAGEVYVVWNSIGTSDVDFMRITRSPAGSQGQAGSFSTPVNVAAEVSNFGNGAPGFNRGMGITFPGIAVDRSSGSHRGRVYVSWNECVDFFTDSLGTLDTLTEAEPNNNFASANSMTIGQTVQGAISVSNDIDLYKFTGTAGETVILYAGSVASTLDMGLRLFCSDTTTRLAYSALGMGSPDIVVFTLPSDGTYYMRCDGFAGGTGGTTGSYTVFTGFHHTPNPVDRSRDHRDAFVAWSDNPTSAASWSVARSSDSPAGFDDWLPEVAVAGDNANPLVGSGKPYSLWYDWRDSPPSACGGVSNVYLARSDNGGGSWTTVGTITNTQTFWSSVASDIAPNQGDYLSLFTDTTDLYASWADGRNGDPDVFASYMTLESTAATLALYSVSATATQVTLTWYASPDAGVTTATVQRSSDGVLFDNLADVVPDGSGYIVYMDTTVTSGGRYYYRLSALGGTLLTPPELVIVPEKSLVLRGAQPNPVDENRPWFVSFELPNTAVAKLELFDVAGRRVAERDVSGVGPQSVQLSEGVKLKPGLYLIRLTQNGVSLTTRVSVVR